MNQEKQLDYVVYIGRFQPPHLAHIETIKQSLNAAENIIILVGSSCQPRTIKNPWTWQERETMIRNSIDEHLQSRIIILPIRDKTYNDQSWVTQVQQVVGDATQQSTNVGIIGHNKDSSSYYLEMFPQWEFTDIGNIKDIHSTDIRKSLFESDGIDFDIEVGRNLPTGIHSFLQAFMKKREYDDLVSEYKFIDKYKSAWKSAPYAPTFNTVDAVVIQSGHVLLVKRRSEPGKNLWAISGGFINEDEKIEDAALRELKEETKIKVPIPVLRGSIKATFVADAPGRSLRGRTISHVFGIELLPGPLPKISKSGGDDAAKAQWIPLSVFKDMEDQMFEDHYHLVNKILELLTQ